MIEHREVGEMREPIRNMQYGNYPRARIYALGRHRRLSGLYNVSTASTLSVKRLLRTPNRFREK